MVKKKIYERKYKTNTKELRKMLIEKELESIQALAETTGISIPTIRSIIKGTAQPNVGVIDILMQVLELSPSRAGEIFFDGKLN